MSYIRGFGRWLQAAGHDDAYVLSDRWKAPLLPPQPYMLSRQEIEQFFTAAARLDTTSPWRWQAAAFFTLMHSCGLRTGETLALQTAHVDLDYGNIDIVWSKENPSRRLPVTEQVARVLDACDGQSRSRFPGRANFFVSGTGHQVTRATAARVFARIWDEAGLARPPGGRQPVPYDFRHHFAYACIERWRTQRKDVHAMLPAGPLVLDVDDGQQEGLPVGYDAALAAGWPIATGIVEGACRHNREGRNGHNGRKMGP